MIARFLSNGNLILAGQAQSLLSSVLLCVSCLIRAYNFMILKLVRVTEYNGATMGALCFNDKPELLTLEEPWRDNQRNISCIPEGKYKIKRILSPKFGITFEVSDVPDRSNILFHRGNTIDDTQGCILVGQRYGVSGSKQAILNSSKAFETFLKIMSGIDEATLYIISACQVKGVAQ